MLRTTTLQFGRCSRLVDSHLHLIASSLYSQTLQLNSRLNPLDSIMAANETEVLNMLGLALFNAGKSGEEANDIFISTSIATAHRQIGCK